MTCTSLPSEDLGYCPGCLPLKSVLNGLDPEVPLKWRPETYISCDREQERGKAQSVRTMWSRFVEVSSNQKFKPSLLAWLHVPGKEITSKLQSFFQAWKITMLLMWSNLRLQTSLGRVSSLGGWNLKKPDHGTINLNRNPKCTPHSTVKNLPSTTRLPANCILNQRVPVRAKVLLCVRLYRAK